MKLTCLSHIARWPAGLSAILLFIFCTGALAFHHEPPSMPHHPPGPPVIVTPPVPVPVIPKQPIAPPPVPKNMAPTPEQAAQIAQAEKTIKNYEDTINRLTAELADVDAEISEKEGVINDLDERINHFSNEKAHLLSERDDIRRSLNAFRNELTDNEDFMAVRINMRTAAVPGHPVTTRLIDFWIEVYLDTQIKNIPKNIEYLQREYLDPTQAKLDAWLEWAATQPASQRDSQAEWGRQKYEPALISYKKQIQDYKDKLSKVMAAKDRLLAMRPTIDGAEDRIRRIEARAVELDSLINEDVSHRDSLGGLQALHNRKKTLEKQLVYNKSSLQSSKDYLKRYKDNISKGENRTAKAEPLLEPPKEASPAAEPEPAPTAVETQPAATDPTLEAANDPALTQADIPETLSQLKQDVEYHLRNRDRAEAELRSIRQRPGTESQQADLRSKIAASEEFALMARRELSRLGGSMDDYVKENLSDYDPYKITQTDLNLMELSARARAEKEATDQLLKTRQFIRNSTDQADAYELIKKLDRIAGFDNQGGLRDFERLDAIREFRSTVYETRTMATYSEQMLEATLSEISNTEYEIGAFRAQVGSTIALGIGTGGLGMASMGANAGMISMTAGTAAATTAQAATASKLLLAYNLSTGTINGYAAAGKKGAVEGAAKEVLPVNTYIAIRDKKGGGTILMGMWQDAGNLLQLHSFAKSVKTAMQAKTIANVEKGLSGPEAALNRSWKLEQEHLDFLSGQISAQSTVYNTTETKAPDKIRSGTPAPISAGNASSGNQAQTMTDIQAQGRDLVKAFDAGASGNTGKRNQAAAVTSDPVLETQMEIIRGMSEGKYSPIVADNLLQQATGQDLTTSMTRLSGTLKLH